MRVLVVEHERLLAEAIADGLRRQAMAVDVAYDGDAALEQLAVNDYDVVLDTASGCTGDMHGEHDLRRRDVKAMGAARAVCGAQGHRTVL
jgi:DNA-binding response OmpR family regulator